MFQVVDRHLELIFFHLNSPNFAFVEVVKAMFQGLACYFEIIFGILAFPN